MQTLLVLTTLPDTAAAEALAAKLIAEHLAACVSIGSPIRSLYHWQGKTETANEIPMTIKTAAGVYPELESAIRSLHPYELPEIIAVPITAGSTPYLNWIMACVDRSGEAADA